MRTKNLLMRKPKGGFCGLAAVLLSFSWAFAVFAAGGMVLAGCDNLAGAGTGDESAFAADVESAEAAAPEDGSAGGPSFDASGRKTIKVKFNVKNGGWGLRQSEGMISTWDDYNIVYNWGSYANDYTIWITVPEAEEWLNVRWRADDLFRGLTRADRFYVFAQIRPVSCTITLDYNGYKNGQPRVATENLIQPELLYGADTVWDDEEEKDITLDEYWDKLKKRSVED